MSDIIELDDHRPHATTSVECKCCSHKWVAVYPVTANYLECPGCHEMVNQYGTKVYVTHCMTCGREFSVCPYPEDVSGWQHCLDKHCKSYDPARDVDHLFENGGAELIRIPVEDEE